MPALTHKLIDGTHKVFEAGAKPLIIGRLPESEIQVRDAFISRVHAGNVGEASVILGAGRAKKSDAVDHAVGIVVHKKVGDWAEQGEPLFTIHANDEARLTEAQVMTLDAFSFSDDVVAPLPLFYD